EDAVLCFTGARLEAIKGYQHQLAAIARLKNTPAWPRLYFVWAGEGGLQEPLRDGIWPLGVQDPIKLVGVSWEVSVWLDAADIFILPSEAEGMPLAVMEAMAKGLPVIATAVSGLPEELGLTGKLLSPPQSNPERTARELAETIASW